MHEFTSISVSSYDAASLADKLTEKSAAGWDVVAIVPAGTNITAYLSRDAETADTAPSWDTGSAAASDDDTPTSTSFGDAEGAGDTAGTATAPGYATDASAPEPAWEPEPVAEEPAPVEEPAGWAVAPEPANTTSDSPAETSPAATPYIGESSEYTPAAEPAASPEPSYGGEPRLGATTAGYDTGSPATPGYETGTSTGEPDSGYETATTGQSTGYDAGATAGGDTGTTADTGYDTGTAAGDTGYDSGAGGAAASTASTAAGTTESAAATPSAAPAGWYADPSGRYELRYWDGNQWTEHVSRAGQQYTDPPVA